MLAPKKVGLVPCVLPISSFFDIKPADHVFLEYRLHAVGTAKIPGSYYPENYFIRDKVSGVLIDSPCLPVSLLMVGKA